MNIEDELWAVRNALIGKVDLEFDRLQRMLGNAQSTPIERTLPLSGNPAVFKGTKPAAVLFGSERVEVSSWKMVFAVVLARCNQSKQHHAALMELRERAAGKCRVFLSRSPDHMKRPHQIDLELYAETHYGTETLLHILCNRLLAPVHYDYSGVSIALTAR
ncbi:hypothetical protein LJC63_12875 [Ruminococcaceae bacterium OttesenSCG-928-L11]|nr:hypothetical protein [Ruminococcaceae bacterium OttesenSCG-928-L11]